MAGLLRTQRPPADDRFVTAAMMLSVSSDPARQLRAVYELAKFGPIPANINPLRILFLRPGKGRERLLPLMNEGNRAKTDTAPVVAVLSNDHTFHERIPELRPYKPELREVFAANEAMRDSAARYNGALQAAYFIIAIRAVGLAAGPMIGFDAAAVDSEFSPTPRGGRISWSTSAPPVPAPGSIAYLASATTTPSITRRSPQPVVQSKATPATKES